MLRVGLTGGIACGKSHVLARLATCGFATLDLDRVAHEVIAPGAAAYSDVVAAFGPGILDAERRIDRKRLGASVFADPVARERLNAIVHPRVREVEAREAAALADKPGTILVTDAALLVEAGLHLRFDRLVVVHCPPEEQLRRLQARDGLDEDAALARLDAQMPIGEKRLFAHAEVDTSGSLGDTEEATDRLAEALEQLAAAPRVRAAVGLERAAGVILNGPANGPRGLEPRALLEALAGGGGVEMQLLAARLSPPAAGPWYRAARGDEGDPGPEALAGPLALWAVVRLGGDRDWLAAAAASLARLTHRRRDRIAGACLAALAIQDALLRQAAAAPIPELRSLAERWGGAAAPAALVASLPATLERLWAPPGAIPEELAASLRQLSEGPPRG